MKFLRTLFGLVKLWRSDEPDYVAAPEGADYSFSAVEWPENRVVRRLCNESPDYPRAILRIYELEQELERLKR